MTNYQAGDEVDTDGTPITLATRKSFRGNNTRWNWVIDGGALGSETGDNWHTSAELAIADARQTLAAPQCTHGLPTTQFCVDYHDQER